MYLVYRAVYAVRHDLAGIPAELNNPDGFFIYHFVRLFSFYIPKADSNRNDHMVSWVELAVREANVAFEEVMLTVREAMVNFREIELNHRINELNQRLQRRERRRAIIEAARLQ